MHYHAYSGGKGKATAATTTDTAADTAGKYNVYENNVYRNSSPARRSPVNPTNSERKTLILGSLV